MLVAFVFVATEPPGPINDPIDRCMAYLERMEPKTPRATRAAYCISLYHDMERAKKRQGKT